MKGIVTKVQLLKTEITECNKISAFCLKNGYLQHAENLNAFIFLIFNKILLGALGIWLSMQIPKKFIMS